MSIIIRAPDLSENDKQYDDCGTTTEAILEINSVSIPLCEECIQDLREQLAKYDATVFCKDCKYWHQSEYGDLTGTCEYQYVQIHGKFDLTKDFGYSCCEGYMHTCKHGIRKESSANDKS